MLDEYSVYLAVLMLDFHIPQSHSLKEKRRVIKSFKDKVKNKFNVSITEVAELDKWQRAIFGVSMIGNDQRHLNECLQQIVNMVVYFPEMQLLSSKIEFV